MWSVFVSSISSMQTIFTLVSDSMASDNTDKSLYINSSSTEVPQHRKRW